MNNVTGSAVVGKDFHGREFELERLLASLRLMKDVLILSPRRVGKSSISLQSGEKLKEEGWLVISTDAEYCVDEAGFFNELEGEILKVENKKIKKSLSKIAKTIKKEFKGSKFGAAGASFEYSGGDSGFSWEESQVKMRASLGALADYDGKVLIILDELPIFLSTVIRKDPENGEERCRCILNWLRSIQKKHSEDLCWLLCGSIGLDSLVDYLKMPAVISDFELQHVGPMTEENAKGLIWALSAGSTPLQVDEHVISRMLERIGWHIPSYIQLLYHCLANIEPQHRSVSYPAVTVADVDVAYDNLTSRSFSSKFSHWDIRLDEGFLEYGQAAMARQMLRRLCRLPQGQEKADLAALIQQDYVQLENDDYQKLFGATLHLLINDGYLDESESICAFRSPILRDHWLNIQI